MKKILTFVFACTALLSVSAADTVFRVDMDARKDKVVLKPEASEKMNATPIGWIKDVDARKYTITSWSKQKVSGTEWEDYKIVFVPATSGSIAQRESPRPTARAENSPPGTAASSRSRRIPSFVRKARPFIAVPGS